MMCESDYIYLNNRIYCSVNVESLVLMDGLEDFNWNSS